MTEAFTGEPIPAAWAAAFVSGQLNMARDLAPHLSDDGLSHLRVALLTEGRFPALPGPLRALRAELLSAVAAELGRRTGATEYFKERGDILPDGVPDDISSM